MCLINEHCAFDSHVSMCWCWSIRCIKSKNIVKINQIYQIYQKYYHLKTYSVSYIWWQILHTEHSGSRLALLFCFCFLQGSMCQHMAWSDTAGVFLKKEENLCAYTHIHTNTIKVSTCIRNTPIICYFLSVHLLIVAVNYDYINVSCL